MSPASNNLNPPVPGKHQTKGSASKLVGAIGRVIAKSPRLERHKRSSIDASATEVRHGFELTGKLLQLKEFIQASTPAKPKKPETLADDLDATPSSNDSTPSNSTLPIETKVTTLRSEEASMLKSVASTAHTSKTTIFNSTFKKSIHKVGLKSIIGRDLLLLYLLYCLIVVLAVVFIVVRVAMLANIIAFLDKQAFLVEQEAAIGYFHRADMLNQVLQKQMIDPTAPKLPASYLFSARDIKSRYDEVVENFNNMIISNYQEIWDQEVKYLLADNTTADIRLGSGFRNMINDFHQLSEIPSSEYYPPTDTRRRTINLLRLIKASMGFFWLLQGNIDGLMNVDLNLFVTALVASVVLTCALAYEMLAISRKASDFFNRCSVIFDRLDADLLTNEAQILDAALALDQKAFAKVSLYANLKLPKKKKPGHSSSLKSQQQAKDSAKKKKEANVRILIPGNDKEKKNLPKRADLPSGRLKRVHRDLKMSKRTVVLVTVLILFCLLFPILLDWVANIGYRHDILELNKIHSFLSVQSQHSSLDVNILLVKIDRLDEEELVSNLILAVDSQTDIKGYPDLYDNSQMIRENLGSSYMDGNLCRWTSLTQDLAVLCKAFSRNQDQFSILNAASSIIQGLGEANTILDEGGIPLIGGDSVLKDIFMLTAAVESKLRSGVHDSKAVLQSRLKTYLEERSLIFCFTIAFCLGLIITVHYRNWLVPTSRFWRRVARTMAILPKNIIMQSNFFMKAHFEHIIKSK